MSGADMQQRAAALIALRRDDARTPTANATMRPLQSVSIGTARRLVGTRIANNSLITGSVKL